MAYKLEKTEYIKFKGTASWVKAYKPDEYEGAVNWTLQLEMTDEEDIKRFKEYFPKKKLKDGEKGKYWNPRRPTTKLIKGKVGYFTPPIIYNRDGEMLAGYTDKDGKLLRQYDDPATTVLQGGPRPLIGNGSEVEVTICTYPTGMGNGNRLESIKVLDMIEYVQENKTVWAEGKEPVAAKEEAPKAVAGDDEIPW